MSGVCCIRSVDPEGEKLVLQADDRPLTFAEVLAAWRDDAEVRDLTLAALAASDRPAVLWEMPRLDRAALGERYESMILPALSLDTIAPDRRTFADRFAAQPDASVIVFDNLSGDAMLVAPRPEEPETDYGHLLAFVRTAPLAQRHMLLHTVAEIALKRVESRPLWISTSGFGVAWLHVRLDARPKYYACRRYRLGK